MLEWLWIWAFALTPMPLLVRLLDRRGKNPKPALRYPLYGQLMHIQGQAKLGRRRSWLRLFLACAIWMALVTALARPTWIGEPVPIPQAGRDLLLAVDISQSCLLYTSDAADE